jgi:y4mF family transcriptional regulator
MGTNDRAESTSQRLARQIDEARQAVSLGANYGHHLTAAVAEALAGSAATVSAIPMTLFVPRKKLTAEQVAIEKEIVAARALIQKPSAEQIAIARAKEEALAAFARQLSAADRMTPSTAAEPSGYHSRNTLPQRPSENLGYVRSIASDSTASTKPVRSSAQLGMMVKSARKRMKLSQQSFADLAGVGRRFVSELENGKGSVEFDKVIACARAAGIDVLARPRQPC